MSYPTQKITFQFGPFIPEISALEHKQQTLQLCNRESTYRLMSSMTNRKSEKVAGSNPG